MVKVTIIGWYGTETIGDRAILAGIFSILGKAYNEYEVQLGAIYPFFTERTLMEDEEFYRKCSGKAKFKISIFDTQEIKELKESIKWCDVLVMGGGPLMGIWSLYLVEYAFAKAKKLGKKTITLGCGVGPMILPRYEKCLVNIIQKSDITIFRDQTSADEYIRLAGKAAKEVSSAIDPAVIAAQRFREMNPNIGIEDFVIACVRDFPMEYRINNSISSEAINAKVVSYLQDVQQRNDKELRLIPMHYFAIGGDDRVFMNKLKQKINNSRVEVQNDPLSLEETFRVFVQSSECVGMRFHSVVLQTTLNGRNIVLDYTNPEKGKIGGFLRQVNALEHYKCSYVNLQVVDGKSILTPASQFKVNEALIDDFENKYVQEVSKLKI